MDALHASYISDVHWYIYEIVWKVVATLITCTHNGIKGIHYICECP